MKGIIFNLFEAFCIRRLGEETYEALVEDIEELETDPRLMVAPGTYADEDFFRLVRGAATRIGVAVPELLRDFGRFALARLADRYPDFFAPFRHAREFLRFIGMVHHVEIKKLYQDANVPRFSCREEGDGTLMLGYHSERLLCPFVEGLIEGVGVHYGVAIDCRHRRCMADGAASCEFFLHFPDEDAPRKA